MSKLLKRAKVQYKIACDCYLHFADDDAFIDACCYNLQQAIELCLKFAVELHGENYAENHDLRANLNKLSRLNIEVPMAKEIRDMASTLYSWETESRYNDDFIALIEDIDSAKEIGAELIRYCNSLYSQSPIEANLEYPTERK